AWPCRADAQEINRPLVKRTVARCEKPEHFHRRKGSKRDAATAPARALKLQTTAIARLLSFSLWSMLLIHCFYRKYGKDGGESGIRTHVRVSPKHAFQACAFSHSAISPAQLETFI